MRIRVGKTTQLSKHKNRGNHFEENKFCQKAIKWNTDDTEDWIKKALNAKKFEGEKVERIEMFLAMVV